MFEIELPPDIDDPNRPPDWRWKRAEWLIKHEVENLEKEDKVVQKTIEFMKASTGSLSVKAVLRLKQDYPGIFQAAALYKNDSKGIRYAIEARLLARQRFDEIAGTTATTVHGVRMYEAIFFNVADRLGASDYIASVIIGEAMHRSINPRDYHLLWKLYAYMGGVQVLDAVIAGRANDEMTRLWFEADASNALTVRHSIAARTVPIAFNHAIVFDAFAKLKAAQRAAETGDASSSGQLIVHVKEMLEAYGGAVSGGLYRPTDSDRYGKFDDTASELRADDMLRVNSGLPTTLNQESAKFPEPPKMQNSK